MAAATRNTGDAATDIIWRGLAGNGSDPVMRRATVVVDAITPMSIAATDFATVVVARADE